MVVLGCGDGHFAARVPDEPSGQDHPGLLPGSTQRRHLLGSGGHGGVRDANLEFGEPGFFSDDF